MKQEKVLELEDDSPSLMSEKACELSQDCTAVTRAAIAADVSSALAAPAASVDDLDGEHLALKAWSQATFSAHMELSRDNVEAAKEFYIDALNASLAMKKSQPIFYAQTQVALASVFFMCGDAIGAICFLHDVLPIYEKYYGRVHQKMLEVYHLLANVHHQYGLLLDAKQWYEACLEAMGWLGFDSNEKLIVIENYAALLSSIESELVGATTYGEGMQTIDLAVDVDDDYFEKEEGEENSLLRLQVEGRLTAA